jgi:hypothetical protein
MPNDSPDFTRAGCTLTFLGAQTRVGSTLKSVQVTIPVNTTGVTVFPLSTHVYQLFVWGLLSPAHGKTFVLNASSHTGAFTVDSLGPSTSASNRLMGIRVHGWGISLTLTTSTNTFRLFTLYQQLS